LGGERGTTVSLDLWGSRENRDNPTVETKALNLGPHRLLSLGAGLASRTAALMQDFKTGLMNRHLYRRLAAKATLTIIAPSIMQHTPKAEGPLTPHAPLTSSPTRSSCLACLFCGRAEFLFPGASDNYAWRGRRFLLLSFLPV